MSEQPGQPGPLIRPLVDRPAQLPLRKLPANARHMPVGVSANTIDVETHIRIQRLRRLLFIGVPLTVLLAVVIAAWIAARHLSPLGPKVIVNSAYEYHFVFYKTAEPVNLDQGAGLQDGNRVLVIAKPTTAHSIVDCTNVGKQWHRAFKVNIEGRSELVCTPDSKVYLAIFPHEDSRQLFEVTYTTNQQGKEDDVRQMLESLHVSRP